MAVEKIATQMEAVVLSDLRKFAKASDRKISSIITEAVADYLSRHQMRPLFASAADEVLSDHAELLKRLAK